MQHGSAKSTPPSWARGVQLVEDLADEVDEPEDSPEELPEGDPEGLSVGGPEGLSGHATEISEEGPPEPDEAEELVEEPPESPSARELPLTLSELDMSVP